MSNSAVGTLYKRIIDQVVESSRGDFEENGVNTRMVQTFQETWQGHLTQRHTAHFPWEPPPVSDTSPATSMSRTATASTSQTSRGTPATSQSSPIGNGVHIKQEPGQANDNHTMPMAPPTGFTAQDRALHNSQQYLQTNRVPAPATGFGNISLPQQQGQDGYGGGMQYPNQQMYQQQRMPQQQQMYQQRDVKQYPQQQQQQQYDIKQSSPQIKQEQRPDGFGASQTDGAGDEPDAAAEWSAIMARNREIKADAEGMRRADGMLKRHIADQMRSLEGGGLLAPLDERYTDAERKHGSRRPVTNIVSSQPGDAGEGPSAVPPAQFDGNDDDDDDDKDAINSDLDDSEDDLEAANVGEEFEGDTIICLYDKVQRVKNKWKCVLKDGVLNADGKDYVFHKANGEFEW